MLDNMKFGQGGVSPAGFKQLDNCFSQDIADVVLLAQELLESGSVSYFSCKRTLFSLARER